MQLALVDVHRQVYRFVYRQDEYHDASVHRWIVPPLQLPQSHHKIYQFLKQFFFSFLPPVTVTCFRKGRSNFSYIGYVIDRENTFWSLTARIIWIIFQETVWLGKIIIPYTPVKVKVKIRLKTVYKF